MAFIFQGAKKQYFHANNKGRGLIQFFKENPSHLSYFSVGKMCGSSHLAQKHVA